MKKGVIILSVLLAFAIAVYLFIFSWLVPNTASISLPYKWRYIPVKQSKLTAHNYFGDPFINDSTGISGKEVWSAGSKGRMYLLRLNYTDSVVTGYSIRYAFSNAIVSKSYLLDTFSVR